MKSGEGEVQVQVQNDPELQAPVATARAIPVQETAIPVQETAMLEAEEKKDRPAEDCTGVPAEGGSAAPAAEPGHVHHTGSDVKVAIDAVQASGNPMEALATVNIYALLVALLISTIVVFVAAIIAAAGTVNGLSWWAFAGALINLLLVIILIILKKCTDKEFVSAAPIMAIVLLVLWLAVTLPATFGGPFTLLSNGWIAAWVCVFLAATLVNRTLADLHRRANRGVHLKSMREQAAATRWSLFIGLASIVDLVAGATTFNLAGICAATLGFRGYNLALAILSILLVVAVLVVANVQSFKKHSNKTNLVISIVLLVWWSVGALVVTCGGPFTGNACSLNGYISVMFCLVGAVFLFKNCGLATVREWFHSKHHANSGGAGAPAPAGAGAGGAGAADGDALPVEETGSSADGNSAENGQSDPVLPAAGVA